MKAYDWLSLIMVILFFGAMGLSCVLPFIAPDMMWVSDERATEYILEMTGAESLVILNDDGNEIYPIHDIQDVTFDMRLIFADGSTERRQFRCTDGYFRPLICRSYE